MENSNENININDLINTLKSKLNYNTHDSPPENPNIDINSIFNTISQNTSKNTETQAPNFDLGSILGNFSSKDPRKELLLSLKPFLNKSRQDKLDTYISLLSLSSVLNLTNIFTAESSDKNA